MSWLRAGSAQQWNVNLRDAFSQAATSVQRLAEQVHLPDEEQLQQFGRTLKTSAQTIATQANAALEAAEDSLIEGFSGLAGALDPDADESAAGLSGSKLQQRFEEEGRALSSCASIVELLDVLKGWVDRLTGPGGPRADALVPFLRSGALGAALAALANLRAGRAALRVAAGLTATRDGNSGAPVAVEVGAALQAILACTSVAGEPLRAKLLGLLADASAAAAAKAGDQGKAHAMIADAPEVRLALSLLMAVTTDAGEVPSASRGSRSDSLEACLQVVTEASAEPGAVALAPEGSDEVAALAAGDEVWAEWPGDGRWFRARIVSVSLAEQQAEVEWLPVPPDIKCGQDEEYLGAAVGTSKPGASLPLRAIRPGGVSDRPCSWAAVGEAAWPQAVASVDALARSFRELRDLSEALSNCAPQGDASEDAAVKALEGKRAALAGVCGQVEEATDAAAPKGHQTLSPEQEAEAQSLEGELAQCSRRAGEIEQERQGLLARLKALDAEAQANKAALSTCEQQLQTLGRGPAAAPAQPVLSPEERQSLLREVKGLVDSRLDQARAAVEERGVVATGRLPEVSGACRQSEQLRRRRLEALSAGLHAAAWGPDADAIVGNPARLEALRAATQSTAKLAEHAWREMVQMAAESFGDDGSVCVNSEDASRSAKRYKEMRQGLQANLDRLVKLEMSTPKAEASAAPAAPAVQAPVMGFVPPPRASTPSAAVGAASAAAAAAPAAATEVGTTSSCAAWSSEGAQEEFTLQEVSLVRAAGPQATANAAGAPPATPLMSGLLVPAAQATEEPVFRGAPVETPP